MVRMVNLMNASLEDMRRSFLRQVREFKLMLQSNNRFVQISSHIGDLRFVLFETFFAFVIFAPLFLLFFSPGVILLSNLIDTLFLSFIFSSLFIVLPVNTILAFLGRCFERKTLKEEKTLLKVGKSIIDRELAFLRKILDAKIELQKDLSEKDLIDMIIEDNGEKLAYGPRELILRVKDCLNFIIMDSEFFDNQYGRFLIFKFDLPLKIKLTFSSTITASNEKADEKVAEERGEIPEWYNKFIFLLKKYIGLSDTKEVLLRLENKKLEIVICNYKPLGFPEYSQFLQELKDLICNIFGPYDIN